MGFTKKQRLSASSHSLLGRVPTSHSSNDPTQRMLTSLSRWMWRKAVITMVGEKLAKLNRENTSIGRGGGGLWTTAASRHERQTERTLAR
ncbi:hypothetical protein E2562_003700 [Oryza meyeriana var. granulata]|uniref:Uncharacterized protein n=1 Tax=Oryza meyeriana var. granulata TaxID=110450 RepID=A0A6G1C3T6_9ORYZ|nr:hypothetical protein E2562_003700 [Oryza meyeriana var. granulata]